MTFFVEVTDQADREAELSAGWWAEHRSIDQAIQWLRCFERMVATLSEMPQSHSLSNENDDFPYELRDLLFGVSTKPTHRAVFTILDDRVVVLTVRHFALDRLTPADIDPFE